MDMPAWRPAHPVRGAPVLLGRAHRLERVDDFLRFREAFLLVLGEDQFAIGDDIEDAVGSLNQL